MPDAYVRWKPGPTWTLAWSWAWRGPVSRPRRGAAWSALPGGLQARAVGRVLRTAGPVAGTPAAGGVLVSDPADPFEQAAERAAKEMMLSSAGPAAPRLDEAAPPAGQTIQRAEQPIEERRNEGSRLMAPALPDMTKLKLGEESV